MPSRGQKAEARDDERRRVVEHDLDPRNFAVHEPFAVIDQGEPRADDERDPRSARQCGAAQKHLKRLAVRSPGGGRTFAARHGRRHSRFSASRGACVTCREPTHSPALLWTTTRNRWKCMPDCKASSACAAKSLSKRSTT